MHSTLPHIPRGPLTSWVRGDETEHEMSQFAQRGQQAIMHGMSDLERFMEENAGAMCVTGILLGTFVDKRFLLLPLAIGGLKLWRSLQQ